MKMRMQAAPLWLRQRVSALSRAILPEGMAMLLSSLPGSSQFFHRRYWQM